MPRGANSDYYYYYYYGKITLRGLERHRRPDAGCIDSLMTGREQVT